MKKQYLLLLFSLMIVSCAAKQELAINADTTVNLVDIDRSERVTIDNSEDILDSFSSEFSIPNPLFGDSSVGRGRDSFRSLINCNAVLLDDYSSRADMLAFARQDSTDSAREERMDKYRAEQLRDGMFRIRITMDSGFSDKSMEPDHWAMFIENAKGVQIEPTDIVASPVFTHSDSVFSQYGHTYFRTKGMKRTITLYFKQVTFFGEDLLSMHNPYLVLVISREQKKLARIAWHHTEKNDYP